MVKVKGLAIGIIICVALSVATSCAVNFYFNNFRFSLTHQYIRAFLFREYIVRNPSYNESIRFIILDKTNEKEFTATYLCVDFAIDFKHNAFQSGYKCGVVIIDWEYESHAIVCFNTESKHLAKVLAKLKVGIITETP